MRSATRQFGAIGIILALSVLVGACGSDTSDEDGTGAGLGGAASGQVDRGDLSQTPRPEADLDFLSCGSSLECATLYVPIDWDDPDGAEIDLAVARRLATGPGPRLGVLVINPGGPGASGIDFLNASGTLHGLNEWFDLVSWDPRGVGASAGISCDGQAVDRFRTTEAAPGDATGQAELETAALTFAQSCEARSAEMLEHLGTEATVQDLDELRIRLGEQQLNFLGLSYGTLIGQRYADRYGEQVRAMVLDGVVDPSGTAVDLLTAQAEAFELVLDETFAGCDELGQACPLDDLSATYDQVAASLVDAPVTLDDGRIVTSTALVIASLMPGYDPSLAPTYYQGLASAAEGDPSTLVTLAQRYWNIGDFPTYIATLCLDLAHPDGPAAHEQFAEDLAERAPRLGQVIANEVLPCAYWPNRQVAPGEPIVAPDAPPILVVGNTGDAATPVELAERVAGSLDSGVLLVHEGEGHTSLSSSNCVRDVVITYLVELSLPAEGTVCED